VDIGAIMRRIDLGLAGDDLFLLRLGVGLEAEITHTADREMKDRLGSLAYVAATFQAWGSAPVSHYRLEMEEEAVEIDGLACMVANAASLGIPGLTLSQHVSVDDGLLDVFVIRKADLGELTRLAASVVGAAAPDIGLAHWQTRGLTIHADPPQGVEADGEELGMTPVHVSVIPGAVKVIVPR
jgi:diacylglycerol kinase family enzyme